MAWERHSWTKSRPRLIASFNIQPLGIRYPHEPDAVELIAFPFGLFDQIRSDEILITSLMDLRRDPARWKDLL